MSWPVAHELLADLRRLHWVEASLPGPARPPPPVIAAIPSVTEFSRTSLLAGMAHPGQAGRRAAAVPGRSRRSCPGASGTSRRCCSTRASSPRGAAGRWPGPVAQAVLNAQNRLVAVVINAVDDRLAGAQQVRDTWSVEAIRPLGALLQLARESGRAVVLASDHGHVWHRDQAATARPGRRRPLAARRRRRRTTARSCWRGRGCSAPRATPPADRPLGRGRPLPRGPQRLPRRGDAPGDGRPAGRAGRRDRPPARAGAVRAAPAGLVGGAGRPATRRDRGTGRPPPPPEPRTPAGYLFPLEPGPAEAEVPVPHPPRRPPSRSRGRPTRPGWRDLTASPAYQAQRQMVRKFAPRTRSS